MYLDLFDSTKSGHPLSTDTKNEWWRSDDEKMQGEAIRLAHAGMVMRLLYGDTIVLPNNQAIDSVAWLRAAQKITTSPEKLPFVPITWVAHNINPTPESFVKTAEDLFRPKSPDPIRSHLKQFKLSAWAGLDAGMREQIANNLMSKKSFKFMLDGVLKDVDPSLQVKFQEQAEALHYFDLYLKNNYTNSEWSVDVPTVIKPSDTGSRRSIWEDLNSLRNRIDGIPAEILNEIVKKVGILNVEIRSALYEGISEIDDKSLRNRIKNYIDRFYNEKSGISATGGRGIFTMMDQNLDITPDEDRKQDDIADSINPPEGDEGKIALYHLPEEYKGLSAITLDDCFAILKLPKIQSSISSMRSWVRQINALKIGEQQFDAREYRELSKKLHEAIDKHEAALAKELEHKIKIDGKMLFAIVDPASLGMDGSLELAKGFVSVLINTQPWYIKAPVDFALGALEKYVSGLEEIRIRTTAAGTIRKNLRKAAFRNFF